MKIVGIIFIFILIISFAFSVYCLKTIHPERFSDLKNVVKVPESYAEPLTKTEKLDSLYSPFVIRPKETNYLTYTQNCPYQLFPEGNPDGKGEMGSTNAYLEAKYYAQRPLLTSEQYYDMVQELFDYMNNHRKKMPKDINLNLYIYPEEFSQESDQSGQVSIYSDSMKYIMKLINDSKLKVKSMKEYAKVDTWRGEHFGFVDQKIFSFSRYNDQDLNEQERARKARENTNEPKLVVVNFSLHNLTRSISSDVIVTLFYYGKQYYLIDIRFTTKKPTDLIKGVSIDSSKTGNINLNNQGIPLNNGPQWLYANTIENQFFNEKGYHDPFGNNFYIQGGIPEEFKTFIQNEQFKNASLPEWYNGQANPPLGNNLFPEKNVTKLNSKIVPDFPNTEVKWSGFV